MKTASQNLTKLVCVFLSAQMVLMPIVYAAENLEQMATAQSEQSVSSDSQTQNQESNVSTEGTENKTKPVDENPEESTEPKNPEDENKNPEEKEPENKTESDPPPLTNEERLQLQNMQNSLANAAKPGEFNPRGKLASDLFTGAANYTYTIETPPGRNGLQPNVSLSYSSMGAKGVAGVAGVGWNLNLSYVQRNVNYTYILDDTGDEIVNETADDKFELYLFGSKIDLVPDGSLIGRYRGKNFPSLYIEAIPNANNKIEQWIVKQPDGTTLLLGGTSYKVKNDLNNFTNRDYISRWYLEKITDSQQTPNEIYYNYLETIKDSPTNLEGDNSPKDDINQMYLTSIKYNNEQNREILFKYEARLDIIPQFQQGLWVQQCYRLHSIETKVSSQTLPVNRWQMEYVDDIRSYLEKIHEAPTDAKKYTTSFGYKRGWPDLNNSEENREIYRNRSSQFYRHSHFFVDTDNNESHTSYGIQELFSKGYLSIMFAEDSVENYSGNNYHTKNFSAKAWGPIDDGDDQVFINLYQTELINPIIECGKNYGYSQDSNRSKTLLKAKYIDIDGDSNLDIVYKQSGYFEVYTNFPAQLHAFAVANDCILPGVPGAPGGGTFTFESIQLPINGFGETYIHDSRLYPEQVGGTSVTFNDLNGDGLPDLIYAQSDTWEIWFNKGNSFGTKTIWPLPYSKSSGKVFANMFKRNGTLDYDPPPDNITHSSLIDLNADGLSDFIYRVTEDEYKCDWNSGNGFINLNEPYLPSDTKISSCLNKKFEYRKEHGLFDINNDGFPDLVKTECILGVKVSSSTKTIYIESQKWTVKSLFNDQEVEIYYDPTLTYMGGMLLYNLFVNDGHGLVLEDYACVEIIREPAGTLMTITNEIGGVSSIEYEESLNSIPDCSDSYFLDGPNTRVWRVKEITTENGMTKADGVITHPHYNNQTTKYEYGKVWTDHKEHDYRGHDWVEETAIGENDKKFKTKHYFHQDDYRKGKEYKTQVFDENEYLLRETENTFSVYDKNHDEITTDQTTWMETPENQYFATFLSDTQTKFSELNCPDRTTQTTYNEYDIYGNIIKETRHGDKDIATDGVKIIKEYAENTSKWIVNKVTKTTIENNEASADLLRTTDYQYDNYGNINRVENWWDGHNNPVTTAEYDNYGNITSVTDPNGNTSHTFYDTETHTFPEKSINALGHITEINDFNPGTGQPLKATDSNGLESHFVYDTFHRVTETRTEKNGELLGKTSYVYFDYSVARMSSSAIPAGTKTAVLLSQDGSESWTEGYKYIDGNGNGIQTRTKADANNDLVADVFYNERGLAFKQSSPYFAAAATSYQLPTTNYHLRANNNRI